MLSAKRKTASRQSFDIGALYSFLLDRKEEVRYHLFLFDDFCAVDLVNSDSRLSFDPDEYGKGMPPVDDFNKVLEFNEPVFAHA